MMVMFLDVMMLIVTMTMSMMVMVIITIMTMPMMTITIIMAMGTEDIGFNKKRKHGIAKIERCRNRDIKR